MVETRYLVSYTLGFLQALPVGDFGFGRRGLEAIEVSFAAEVKGFTGDGWGSHEAARKGIGRQRLQRAAGFDDQCRTVLAGEVEAAIGVDRRSGLFAADAPGP